MDFEIACERIAALEESMLRLQNYITSDRIHSPAKDSGSPRPLRPQLPLPHLYDQPPTRSVTPGIFGEKKVAPPNRSMLETRGLGHSLHPMGERDPEDMAMMLEVCRLLSPVNTAFKTLSLGFCDGPPRESGSHF